MKSRVEVAYHTLLRPYPSHIKSEYPRIVLEQNTSSCKQSAGDLFIVVSGFAVLNMRSFQVVLFAIIGFDIIRVANSFDVGQPHEAVVTLDASNWKTAINDPANPLWLLKYYAPWCGHCKRLQPVLEKVAPALRGQLAIGKIDCTTEKKVCDEQKVRGYPTLKFALDGQIFDYPGGRSADDIIGFAEKMSQPAVRDVSSVAEVWSYVNEQQAEVVFVACAEDNNVKSIFAQVARKQRAVDHFLQLAVEAPDTADLKLSSTSPPFVCRIEQGVPPRCVESIANMDSASLLEFVQAQNFPTVSQLGPHNFNKIGRAGKPLLVGVVDTSKPNQLDTIKEGLTKYAIQGQNREAYNYGWLDGRQWSKFLAQFNVDPKDSPQVFLLNVPDKVFWQNATYGANVQAFVTAVQDGTISQGEAGSKGVERIMQKVYQWMVEYRPWSVILVVLLVVAIAVLIASVVSPPSDDYAYPVPSAKESGVESDGKKEAKETESKKDK